MKTFIQILVLLSIFGMVVAAIKFVMMVIGLIVGIVLLGFVLSLLAQP